MSSLTAQLPGSSRADQEPVPVDEIARAINIDPRMSRSPHGCEPQASRVTHGSCSRRTSPHLQYAACQVQVHPVVIQEIMAKLISFQNRVISIAEGWYPPQRKRLLPEQMLTSDKGRHALLDARRSRVVRSLHLTISTSTTLFCLAYMLPCHRRTEISISRTPNRHMAPNSQNPAPSSQYRQEIE